MAGGSGLLEEMLLLVVVVLTQWGRLLSGLGAGLVLVGLAKRVGREPLIHGQLAGVQRDTL